MRRPRRIDWLGILVVAFSVALLIAVVKANRVNDHLSSSDDLASARAKQSLCIANHQGVFLLAVGEYQKAVGALIIASTNNDDTGIQMAKQQIVTALAELADATPVIDPLRMAVACKLDTG